MTDNPLISIIIPCYNIEDYISKSIQSVLEQTYLNLEIILVNDGSTDKTAEIIDELKEKDNRIKVMHKENGGVTSARLEGIKKATGEWIGFVDGDDYIEPQMYEKLLQNAIKYNADISHCGYQMVFPSRVDYYYNTRDIVLQDNKAGLEDLLGGSFIEPALCSKLFHKTLFQTLLQQMEKYTQIKNNEDLLMNYFLFKNANQSIYEDICPYHYVLRKNSATSSKVNTNKLLDPISVLNIIKDDLQDDNLKVIVEERIIWRLIGLSTLNCKPNKDILKPIKDNALNQLRNKAEEIKKSNFSKKTKLASRLCVSSSKIYSAIHEVYSTIKGTKNKYKI